MGRVTLPPATCSLRTGGREILRPESWLGWGHTYRRLAGAVNAGSATYNEGVVSGVERNGVVFVEASPAVPWSVMIGRSAPADEESPTSSAAF